MSLLGETLAAGGEVGYNRILMETRQWEYFFDEVPEADGQQRIEMWGAKGWELVTVLARTVQNEGPIGDPSPRTIWKLIFKQPGGPVNRMKG
jgi:hypothetical protein